MMSKFRINLSITLILLFIIALRAYTLYWGFLYDGFLVPPGGDAPNHLTIIKNIMATGQYFSGTIGYPPSYHIAMVVLSRLFHTSPLYMVTTTGPLLVLFPVVVTYFAARKLFGPLTGIISAAMVGLVGVGPLRGYIDGNYPNLLGSECFMVLGLSFLVASLREKPLLNLALGTLMLVLLSITHDLSLALFLAIIVSFLVALLFIHRLQPVKLPHYHYFIWLSSGIVITISILGWAVGRVSSLVAYGSFLIGKAPTLFDAYLRTPLALDQYPETIGPLVWYGGVIGLIVLVSMPRKTIGWERRLLLIVWIAFVFLISRLSISGLPARFTRELTIPLAISAGYGLAWFIGEAKNRFTQIITAGIASWLLVTNIAMVSTGPFKLPGGFRQMVWFWPEDQEKLDYLQALPVNSTIASTPSSPFYQVLLDHRRLEVTSEPSQFQYILVANKTATNPDPIAYPYFAQYETIRQALERYPNAMTIKTFADGSVVKKVVNPY